MKGNNKVRIIINGKIYESILEASKLLNISRKTLNKRLNDPKNLDYLRNRNRKDYSSRIVDGIHLKHNQQDSGRIYRKLLDEKNLKNWKPGGALKKSNDNIDNLVQNIYNKFQQKEKNNE